MKQEFSSKKTILLTIDVEDWFQVENFKEYIPYSSWPNREQRVEKNTLDLLDLFGGFPYPVHATFFVLGWVAKRHPELVREIHRRGHEVASHGFAHHLCYNQSPDDLNKDLIKSKRLLEDIIDQEVLGYRAPSFSISDKILSSVKAAGYRYDSSYNSYEGHGRYGIIQLPNAKGRDLPLYTMASSFFEIPVSNLRLFNKVIPWGGGGYFRLLPSLAHRIGVKNILRRNECYTFYMHPWEIDPGQPRIKNAKTSFSFRHYINLHKTKKKLQQLVASNNDCSFITCCEFIKLKQSQDSVE